MRLGSPVRKGYRGQDGSSLGNSYPQSSTCPDNWGRLLAGRINHGFVHELGFPLGSRTPFGNALTLNICVVQHDGR